jgi:T-Q ester bond containing domain
MDLSRRRALRRLVLLFTAVAAVGALVSVVGPERPSRALAPPGNPQFGAYGVSGNAGNGNGGDIAPSPAPGQWWPATGNGNDGGPFAFLGAHYGAGYGIPTTPNNSTGVGYCVEEDEPNLGGVQLQPDPVLWSARDKANAAAVMTTYSGDRVVPYGITAAGGLNQVTGEWEHPSLFSQGDNGYTRRRHVAGNMGVRMFLADVSDPNEFVGAGTTLARDAGVVNGQGGDFAAAQAAYSVAQVEASVAERMSQVGGIGLELVWQTPGNQPPDQAGVYALEVRVTDSTDTEVGFVPVLQLTGDGIDGCTSQNAIAVVDNSMDDADDIARWVAADQSDWPTFDWTMQLRNDNRFALNAPWPDAWLTADVADGNGVARFNVSIADPNWRLAFHVVAPIDDVDLYSGSGVQGNVTWGAGYVSATGCDQHVEADRYIRLAKHSTDPVMAVAGGLFQLIDGNDAVVAQGVTNVDGVVDFPPITPQANPAPYSIREVTAPPGLEPLDEDVPIPPPYSTDLNAPTVVDIDNVPKNEFLVVRKALSDPDAGPDDLSGFEFSVTRVADEADFGSWITGSDGETLNILTTAGSYEVCEVSAPLWAQVLENPGCQVAVVPPNGTTEVQFVFTNGVPVPELGTHARDAADGDQLLGASGGQLVDTVTYDGMVPGTEYTVSGEVMAVATDLTVAPTGILGSTTFTPASPSGTVDVVFTVPANPGFWVGVVFEELRIGGKVVATHHEPGDVEQTFWIPQIGTTARSDHPSGVLASPGTGLTDTVAYRGLPPGEYRADLVWQRRTATGCATTSLTASQAFAVTGPAGSVDVTGVTVTAAELGVALVAFERVYRVTPNGDVLVVVHEDCEAPEQTVWVPALDTAVTAQSVTGSGTMHDLITLVGAPDPLPDGWQVRVVGGLHSHGSTPIGSRSCTTSNEVADVDVLVTDMSNTSDIRTPGEQHGLGAFSYHQQVQVTAPSGWTWESAWHGCNVSEESFESLAPRASDRERGRRLPQAGSDASAIVAVGVFLMAVGVALWAVARRYRAQRLVASDDRR